MPVTILTPADVSTRLELAAAALSGIAQAQREQCPHSITIPKKYHGALTNIGALCNELVSLGGDAVNQTQINEMGEY